MLIAAIEFKSQNESIGNNQNNRREESLSSAFDFWTSYNNGYFGNNRPKPWLGYLFAGAYEKDDIDKKVEVRHPHFKCAKSFEPTADLLETQIIHDGPSYAKRYQIFLEEMIEAGLYNSAAFIVTNQTILADEQNYLCLYPVSRAARSSIH